MARRFGRTDLAIALFDEGLRSLLAPPRSQRPAPAPRPAAAAPAAPPSASAAAVAAGRASDAAGAAAPEPAAADRAESAKLMRVNRAGEIAAQALYLGQALTSRHPATTGHLLAAADEERDHLAWCTERIHALGGRPSLLDPFWFAGSACLGAAVGLAGDAVSLGFIEETEKQVEAHLRDHIGRLPAVDTASRAVLEQMAADEARHGTAARAAGGEPLPPLARRLMMLGGEVLRRLAYRI